MTCEHDLSERETACADGWCPLCIRSEVERLTQSLLIERGKLERADEENDRLRARLDEAEHRREFWERQCDDRERWLKEREARLAVLERQQSAQDALAGYGIDAKGALADVCREMAGRSLAAEARLAEEIRQHGITREARREHCESSMAAEARLAERDETIIRMQGLLETCDAGLEELRARLAVWDKSEFAVHDPVALVVALIGERDEYKARLAEWEAALKIARPYVAEQCSHPNSTKARQDLYRIDAALAAGEGK